MKRIKTMLKNIILSTITIYSFNILIGNVNVFLPINYFSIIFCGIFGFPGLISYFLIIYKYIG